jgi:nitrogen regulatory protein P-II 2
MQLTIIKLVTIIAEPVLRERIIVDVQRLGARGYTLTEVHGHGAGWVSGQEFWNGAQLKLETLVTDDVADRILTHMAAAYFAEFAVIAYVTEARIVRAEKFS